MTQFLRDRDRVFATDVEPAYVDLLRRRFDNTANVEVDCFDLGEDAPSSVARQRYDTIICLNVLEHVADDRNAVVRLRELLEPGGRVIILVPAHRSLFGAMDAAVGHHRRYSRGELPKLLADAGLAVESETYVNAASTPGWFVNGRLLKRRSVPGVQARVANMLVPLYRLERKLNIPFGLSVIAVGRRAD
jgi:2-polyprenyl-3-methyl-5-hydroxy-6-metoxy-1,4-benzoquinol methylase